MIPIPFRALLPRAIEDAKRLMGYLSVTWLRVCVLNKGRG